jgi:NAD(P)-dependent dehydrogenase (short-subunit alcohol dehydrogenase family)
MNIPSPEPKLPSLIGKVCVLTGASGDLGFEIAKILARRGAELILPTRNQSKSDCMINALRAFCPEALLHPYMPLDLASAKSIDGFARFVLRGSKKIDILINNAGVLVPNSSADRDANYAINYEGTVRMMAALHEGMADDARIVNVGSGIDRFVHRRIINPVQSYAISKNALHINTSQCARNPSRREGLSYVSCEPGLINTSLYRSAGWIGTAATLAAPIIGHSAVKAAQIVAFSAASEKVRNGDHISPILIGCGWPVIE